MLLDVSCTVKDFTDFLNNASNEGIKPDFDMEGRDLYSGFGLAGEKPSVGEFATEEYVEESSEPGENSINGDDI